MERRPVCLIVATVASGGSMGAAVARDAREALARGFAVYVASGRAELPQELRKAGVGQIRIGGKVDAGMHYLLAGMADAEGRGSVIATLRFVAAMRRLRPSRIIMHNLHGRYLNLAIFVRQLRKEVARGVELVWMLHDFWPVTGHCAFLPPEGCLRFSEADGCHDCPMSKAYPRTLAGRARSNFRRKKRLLEPLAEHSIVRVVSRWQAALIEKSFFGQARMELHRPLVDEAFTPPRADERRLGFALCVAYPWQKFKGLDDLPALHRALPRGMQLLVVGLDEKQARKLRPLGINCAPRQTTPEALAWYYRHAAVYISVSYAETYGLTVREAIACDTPVALYAVGGITEGLEDHPKVRAVPCGDVNALARAAIELAESAPGR
ncbi:MAG: glycosyltransferase [Muribaculaceae bacterium]|nr:glycosyltransferase [Muribaculaceae bacterium]